jgi:hypothetical protein
MGHNSKPRVKRIRKRPKIGKKGFYYKIKGPHIYFGNFRSLRLRHAHPSHWGGALGVHWTVVLRGTGNGYEVP